MRRILVTKEPDLKETRVALVPEDVRKLIALGFEVRVEEGAGERSGFTDEDYRTAGARIVSDYGKALRESEIVLSVSKPLFLSFFSEGAISISCLDPFSEKAFLEKAAAAGILSLSLKLMPRTTMAQKMDTESSQSSLAGYVAVIKAAGRLPKALAMMVTPAGTINPARVFVIGAGVAGLQAIATAKRLGARVDAFDTRPSVEEEVKSLGAGFVRIDLGETGEGEQGYARELTEEQEKTQRAAIAKILGRYDIVVTTAKVFGKRAPLLITNEAVLGMKKGSVIVDLAVGTGGNTELSRLDEDTVTENGVMVLSGHMLEREVPRDASRMLSGNMTAFLCHFLSKETKEFVPDLSDEIFTSCLLTNGGEITHPYFKTG